MAKRSFLRDSMVEVVQPAAKRQKIMARENFTNTFREHLRNRLQDTSRLGRLVSLAAIVRVFPNAQSVGLRFFLKSAQLRPVVFVAHATRQHCILSVGASEPFADEQLAEVMPTDSNEGVIARQTSTPACILPTRGHDKSSFQLFGGEPASQFCRPLQFGFCHAEMLPLLLEAVFLV